jgi:hypothetical protein
MDNDNPTRAGSCFMGNPKKKAEKVNANDDRFLMAA